MRDRFDRELDRSRRLCRLLSSLEADNLQDSERSAELLEAMAPFGGVSVPEAVRDALDARFAFDQPVTALREPETTGMLPFNRA